MHTQRNIHIERHVNTCADTYLVQMYGSYVKREQGTIIKKVIIKTYLSKGFLLKNDYQNVI